MISESHTCLYIGYSIVGGAIEREYHRFFSCEIRPLITVGNHRGTLSRCWILITLPTS